MPQKVKWAVIGSGGIARRRTIPEGIVPADNAELALVCDVNADANQEVAQEFNADPADSLQAVLDSDVDAVYIATPANLHCQQVRDCAAAGKHVMCEKPLGMTVPEAEEMITACQKANVTLGTAFMMRFSRQHQQALKMIQDGKLGTVCYGRAQLSCWYPPIENAWRQDLALSGGGSLMDMGGHCIDLLEMFLGKLTKVSCFINNNTHSYQPEDSAIVNLFFQNGALATVDAFFCIPDNSSKNILELYGSKGSILARGTIGQGDAGEMFAYLEADDAGYDAQQSRAAADALEIAPTPFNTYRAEVEEFSAALLEKRTPANNAEIGLQSQKVLEACYQSARTGRTIDL